MSKKSLLITAVLFFAAISSKNLLAINDPDLLETEAIVNAIKADPNVVHKYVEESDVPTIIFLAKIVNGTNRTHPELMKNMKEAAAWSAYKKGTKSVLTDYLYCATYVHPDNSDDCEYDPGSKYAGQNDVIGDWFINRFPSWSDIKSIFEL